MPRYTLSPHTSSLFIPELGQFDGDADGVFDLPDHEAVGVALLGLGLTASPAPEAAAANPPASEATGAEATSSPADAANAGTPAEPEVAPAPVPGDLDGDGKPDTTSRRRKSAAV